MADFNLIDPQYWNSSYHKVVGTEGADTLTGTVIDRDSALASMMGGNDFVRIWTGDNNFVNGNRGDDVVEVSYIDDEDGVTRGYGGIFLGGKDNDTMYGFSGTIGTINGNRGNDKIWGSSTAYGTFRGGKDDDQLGVTGGIVYGDKGNDAFLMMPPTSLDEYAWVRDYTPGVDTVFYAPSLGTFSDFVNSAGLWLFQNNNATMLLEGISSIDQVTLIATDNILTQDVI